MLSRSFQTTRNTVWQEVIIEYSTDHKLLSCVRALTRSHPKYRLNNLHSVASLPAAFASRFAFEPHHEIKHLSKSDAQAALQVDSEQLSICRNACSRPTRSLV